MAIDWEPLKAIIDAHERFTLSSHVRPDADALGSELALAGILTALGKSVRIVNPSDMPDTLEFLDPEGRILKFGKSISAEETADTDVHVVLDTSAWGQLQDLGNVLKNTSAVKVVIDHHVSSDDLGAVEFKDPTAEATGTLIFRMARALGYPLNAELAGYLYCAIATDTGWYRFASTTAETMRIAGELIDLGAEPAVIYRQLYEQYSLARVRLAGAAMQRVVTECEGRLAYTWVARDDFRQSGARPVDTEDLVNECLRIAGTECAFIAIEQQNKSIKVSFRSRLHVDVSRVAEQFGGGGHKQAAGAVLSGPLEDAIRAAREAMTENLKKP